MMNFAAVSLFCNRLAKIPHVAKDAQQRVMQLNIHRVPKKRSPKTLAVTLSNLDRS